MSLILLPCKLIDSYYRLNNLSRDSNIEISLNLLKLKSKFKTLMIFH